MQWRQKRIESGGGARLAKNLDKQKITNKGYPYGYV